MLHLVRSEPRAMSNTKRIVGMLDAFFETGTEGVLWAILDNDLTGYDALNILKDGDYLFVEDGLSQIEWEGTVKLDWKINWREFPQNPGHGQQEVYGYWVHGIQEGLDPALWAKWFFEGRRAVAIIKEDV